MRDFFYGMGFTWAVIGGYLAVVAGIVQMVVLLGGNVWPT